jgi:hypothetical protein
MEPLKPVVSDATVRLLVHFGYYGRGFAVEQTNLTTQELNRLARCCAAILAPDLSTGMEDTGRQRVYGCDMGLGHSAFLLFIYKLTGFSFTW